MEKEQLLNLKIISIESISIEIFGLYLDGIDKLAIMAM